MTRDADYWKRRYERSEAGRLEALNQVRDMSARLIDTAADEQQKQIDALETLVLNRAMLVNLERDGRKVRLTMVRRGAPTVIELYGDMSFDLAATHRTLLGDG